MSFCSFEVSAKKKALGKEAKLEEKQTAVPAGKLKKSPVFCAVPEEVRVIKKQGKLDEFYRETGMRTEQTLQQKR